MSIFEMNSFMSTFKILFGSSIFLVNFSNLIARSIHGDIITPVYYYISMFNLNKE